MTIVVNSQDAAPVTRTITLTSAGTQPFRAWLSSAEGLAPFTPTLTIANRGNVPFQRVEIDTEDDGTVDASLTSLPDGTASVALHYPAPGVRTVRVRVVATGVHVLNPGQKVTVYQPKYGPAPAASAADASKSIADNAAAPAAPGSR